MNPCPIKDPRTHGANCHMRVQHGAYNTLDGDSNISIDQCKRPAAYHADEGMWERHLAMKEHFHNVGRWDESDEAIERGILEGRVNPGSCFHVCQAHAKTMLKSGYNVGLLADVDPKRLTPFGRIRERMGL